MEDPQGAGQGIPSTTPPGQGAVPSAPSTVGVDQSNVNGAPSTTPQGQGAEPVNVERLVGSLQGTVDSLRTQLQATQQQMAQMLQQTAPQAQQNPYDPQTQPNEWWAWRDQQYADTVARKTEERLMGVISNAARSQQESQWQSAHPQVNIADVKAFAQARQIGNLDDAFTLMTLPQQQRQTVAAAFTQFQRPQNSAQPLQGAQGAAQGEVQGRFDMDYQAFVQTNGKVYETWDPARRLAFDQEYAKRDAMRGTR